MWLNYKKATSTRIASFRMGNPKLIKSPFARKLNESVRVDKQFDTFIFIVADWQNVFLLLSVHDRFVVTRTCYWMNEVWNYYRKITFKQVFFDFFAFFYFKGGANRWMPWKFHTKTHEDGILWGMQHWWLQCSHHKWTHRISHCHFRCHYETYLSNEIIFIEFLNFVQNCKRNKLSKSAKPEFKFDHLYDLNQ